MVDFPDLADNRVKLKECEKTLKKLWNMKETIIPIVISALGTVTKELVQGLNLEITGQVETTQNSTLLRSARILRKVLETLGDLLSLKLQLKTIS